MSIPSATITETGVSVPTTEDVKKGVWDLLKSCFGNTINTSENTPQGQLAVTLTAILQDRDYQMVQVLNQFDPLYSTGKWQNGLGNLYFLKRHSATRSTAQITFTGLNGTVIPKGFQIKDTNGYLWQTTEQYIIDIDGSTVGSVQCVDFGEIGASANTIKNIVTALSGLDRVTNLASAIIGTSEESQQDFETRRAESVSANAKNTDASVRGAIANLNGVIDVWVKSNHSDYPTTFGATNYHVDAHATCISVVGGNDYDIAWQALVKAGTGCSFMGNTNPTVYDRDNYLNDPIPYDVVKFIRPTYRTAYFKIAVADTAVVTPSDQKAVKNAIISALESGSNRARIGQTLRAFSYGIVASNALTSTQVISVQVSRDNKTWSDSLLFGIDEFPTSSIYDISIEGLSS